MKRSFGVVCVLGLIFIFIISFNSCTNMKTFLNNNKEVIKEVMKDLIDDVVEEIFKQLTSSNINMMLNNNKSVYDNSTNNIHFEKYFSPEQEKVFKAELTKKLLTAIDSKEIIINDYFPD